MDFHSFEKKIDSKTFFFESRILKNQLIQLLFNYSKMSYHNTTSFTVNQQLSLYIPQVLLNTTAEEIATVFEKFDFGKVHCVDLVCRQKVDGAFYNSAHIYFDEWNTSGMVSRFQEKVYNGTASMFYEDPYLWEVFENRRRDKTIEVRGPPATNYAGAQLLHAIQQPKTNAAGAQLLRAIQQPKTNAAGARLLKAVGGGGGGGFTLNHCKDRICVLENEVASMKQMLIHFDDKKLDYLSSEIRVIQDYLDKKF